MSPVIDGHGSWTEEGCGLVGVEGNMATCACNHLTNYACLFVSETGTETDGVGPVKTEKTLTTISIIGTGVSILGIAVTIFTLLLFG